MSATIERGYSSGMLNRRVNESKTSRVTGLCHAGFYTGVEIVSSENKSKGERRSSCLDVLGEGLRLIGCIN